MSISPSGRLLSIADNSTNSTKIIKFAGVKTIFEYSTKYFNGDYLSPIIWSPNNELAVIYTKGEGKRRNIGYGGYLSIYPIGVESF